MTAYFVAIEGIDGCGSTTQATMLADWLCDSGIPTTYTREPWPGHGEKGIRELINMDPRPAPWAMSLAFLGDRVVHLFGHVKPLLAGGTTVVTDRYALSTAAYQIPFFDDDDLREAVRLLNAQFTRPDLTIVLDLPVEIARAHMAERGLDAYEADVAFQKKVRAAYLAATAEEPGPVVVINADHEVGEVQASVRRVVSDVLGLA